ncbi:MAG: hypothetical protein BCS36_06290 [Desulfovibrio sp. MES5]|uniref:hypothetical protein n=1 Tax=Desulfovibrio sp. MES5 TaxID=1899016 RepID=UPI000B9CECC3|nr:hypothetical protein [Desulfovibrio sp. MES5]OXS29732.1 MAG: hypothetical protein BCS36_06290 [Desulfovibrio sp. MES5]
MRALPSPPAQLASKGAAFRPSPRPSFKKDRAKSLWKKPKTAQASLQNFFDHFKGREKAIAIEIAKPKRYAKAINTYKGEKITPPQLFRHVYEHMTPQMALF